MGAAEHAASEGEMPDSEQDKDHPDWRIKAFVLTFVLCAYLALGGMGFSLAEHPNEVQLNQKKEFALNHMHSLVEKSNLTDAQKAELVDFVNDQCALDNVVEHWNFVGATFFAVTVISTVGYGTYAPQTTLGRAMVIPYAMFGIPLLGYFISYSSSLTFIWVWRARCAASRWYDRRRHGGSSQARAMPGRPRTEAEMQVLRDREEGKPGVRMATVLTLLWLLVGAAALYGFQRRTKDPWTYLESVYWAFVSLTTIGFGDFVPTSNRLFTVAYILSGLGIVAALVGALGERFEHRARVVQKRVSLARSGLISESRRNTTARGGNGSQQDVTGSLAATTTDGATDGATDGTDGGGGGVHGGDNGDAVAIMAGDGTQVAALPTQTIRLEGNTVV